MQVHSKITNFFGNTILMDTSGTTSEEPPIELILTFVTSIKTKETKTDNINEILNSWIEDNKYQVTKKVSTSPKARIKTYDKSNTIRVSNVNINITEDDLRELFIPYGEIKRINIPTIRGNRCEYGFITFYDYISATKSIQKMDKHKYKHCVLDVNQAH